MLTIVFRYGPWRGGPDPLRPPFDVREAIDRIGQDVLSAGTVRDALRDLMRRRVSTVAAASTGWRKRSGSCAHRRAAAAISAATWIRSGPLSTRRSRPSGRPWRPVTQRMPGWPSWSWTRCPMTSPELFAAWITTRGDLRRHAQIFEEIRRCCSVKYWTPSSPASSRRYESPDPEAMQRVKDMLADLNALLAAHARQEDTTDQFAEFMERHGEFFPEQPETIEELIDALARREAAAMRLHVLAQPGAARAARASCMSHVLADADLAAEMAQLADNLRALRPYLDRDQAREHAARW